MREQPLVDMLAETFQRVEARVEEHRQALASAMTHQTVDYLDRRLRLLRRELSALRGTSIIQDLACGDRHGDDLWQRTASDLLETQPQHFRAPAAAITEANLELYELISYIGAAIALTRERRRSVAAHIAHRLEQPVRGQSVARCQPPQRLALGPLDHQAIDDLLALLEDNEDDTPASFRILLTSLRAQMRTHEQGESSCATPGG